jgi:hypothetical protein
VIVLGAAARLAPIHVLPITPTHRESRRRHEPSAAPELLDGRADHAALRRRHLLA